MILIARLKASGFNYYHTMNTFSLYKNQNQLTSVLSLDNGNSDIIMREEYSLMDILHFNETEFKYEFHKQNVSVLGNLEFKYRLTNEDNNLVEVETIIHGSDGDIYTSIEVGTTTRNILNRLQHITKMMVQDEFAFSLLSKY